MNNTNYNILEQYGENFSNAEYITNPAIGRDKQIQELVLVLLTPEKSAILIGKPGIGKTAIVEGLAYRIQQGSVPDALKGFSIINIKTASLLGTVPTGESKVQLMIDELKQKDKVILFIDEIHMLIGSTETSSVDFANIFKEGLGRGSIKVIGATTSDEYERYILRDKAFTRRFQKIEVPEPSRDETVEIMMGSLKKIEATTGAKLKYSSFVQSQIMGFITDITSEYKRVYAIGSRYPDIALTLLKQAFSYTVFDNRKEVDIFDVKKAIQNTKNVYPDVIRKELPKFDEVFKDIIKEEKGEETGLEWKMVNPTREPKKEPLFDHDENLVPIEVPTPIKHSKRNIPAMDEHIIEEVHMPDFVREADRMLLSGKVNIITKEGVIKAELPETKFPKLKGKKKALPKLEKGTDIIGFQKELPLVSIYDDNNKKVNIHFPSKKSKYDEEGNYIDEEETPNEIPPIKQSVSLPPLPAQNLSNSTSNIKLEDDLNGNIDFDDFFDQ